MTFQPAKPTEPPQAVQSGVDPGEAAIEEIGEAVENARESVQSARERALSEARSDEERAQINARFDAIGETVNESIGRIETAISTGNAQMTAALTQFLDRLDSRMSSMGQGATTDDDDILSIEEIADDITEPVAGAAASMGQAVADAVDEAPRRVHGLFRPLWGGGKE